MTPEDQEKKLKDSSRNWLITGVAGFIGSNLLEKLLSLGQNVVGLDNYSTGYRGNLEVVRSVVGEEAWDGFRMVEGDIRDIEICKVAAADADYVLHQAALGSVPRSISDPVATHENNVNGFLNVLVAARDAKVKRFVYASSSSVYGDHPALPKVEADIGKPLSPYAATKYFNEVYADVFARCYGLETIGLRYFNVFGRRQDPEGAYAAVIPLWFKALLKGEPAYINGDGETTRDFCYVDNAVQANLLAAVCEKSESLNRSYNVAYGERNTLNRLFELIGEEVAKRAPGAKIGKPVYRDFRPGDIRHSLADIGQAKALLGYAPKFDLCTGLAAAADYYVRLLAD
ncbi:MAG: SDR family oxidoreductase [Gammaproteobacteria bacterium]